MPMHREPILEENPNHFVIFPIEKPDLWQFYKQAQATFWTAEEIDLSGDWECLDKLTQMERDYIFKILTFFAASDGIVNENLCQHFANEVQYLKACCFYGFQIMAENIHNETYSLLIDTYVDDPKTKLDLFCGLEMNLVFVAKLIGLLHGVTLAMQCLQNLWLLLLSLKASSSLVLSVPSFG